MDDLDRLAEVIRKRNSLECEITALIARPAQIGHIGEYIASTIVYIALKESASHKSIDGHFREEPLKGCSVNIKWCALYEGTLDVTPDSLPDFHLVLTGPKSGAMSSRGQVRDSHEGSRSRSTRAGCGSGCSESQAWQLTSSLSRAVISAELRQSSAKVGRSP
jgi:hypothetical protein